MKHVGFGLLLVAMGAQAAPVNFDPARPPAAIGDTLAQVLARWGESASFGADCGSWRGPSVDTRMNWRGDELQVMALLQADRVTAMRYERRANRRSNFADCLTSLNDFAAEWTGSGLEPGAVADPVFDGPVLRAARPASLRGQVVGRFEADFRASREECRVALILSSEPQ